MTATVATAAPTSAVPFTALDRCDRCSAQAYVGFDLNGVELIFCVHHTKRHEDALMTSGARVVRDERDKLVEGNRLQGVSH